MRYRTNIQRERIDLKQKNKKILFAFYIRKRENSKNISISFYFNPLKVFPKKQFENECFVDLWYDVFHKIYPSNFKNIFLNSIFDYNYLFSKQEEYKDRKEIAFRLTTSLYRHPLKNIEQDIKEISEILKSFIKQTSKIDKINLVEEKECLNLQ